MPHPIHGRLNDANMLRENSFSLHGCRIHSLCMGAFKLGYQSSSALRLDWIGTYSVGSPNSQAFRLILGLYHHLSEPPSRLLQTLELLSFHNCMSQCLIFHIYVSDCLCFPGKSIIKTVDREDAQISLTIVSRKLFQVVYIL